MESIHDKKIRAMQERRAKLIEILAKDHTLSHHRLGRLLGVTGSTITRDLQALGYIRPIMLPHTNRLSDEARAQIKARLMDGEWPDVLAQEFGVRKGWIRQLKHQALKEAAIPCPG